MKIFQIITVSEYGGAQSVVANLLSEMNKDEDKQLFVLSGGNGEAWSHLDKRIKKIKLENHRKKISWRDLILLIKLLYYRIKYNPDIVHLHSSKIGILGRIIFPKRKVIYTMHGFDSVRKAYSKFTIIEQMVKNRAAYIVPVSQYDAICLAEVGIKRNLKVIYNGQQDYYLTDTKSNTNNLPPELIEKLSLTRKLYPKIVMCIARISPQKKFDLFIKIAEKMPQYAFVWIGNKDEMHGLPANVFCLGEYHSAHQCLSFSDVFILPTNYEGLPISIIEALEYGKPVVASAVGGITEMLDGENGFAVENNVDLFQDKINYILQSEQTYSAMSAKARQSYLHNYTIDKMISEYKILYSNIINKNIRYE